MEPNPYSPPVDAQASNVDASESRRESSGITGTNTRRIALVVFSLPFLLAIPFWYWVFHIAGNWFVNTDIDPDERRSGLEAMYVLNMAAITGAAIFPGLLLLFIDKYRRPLTGWLMVPAFVLFVLAMLVFACMVESYFRFS